MRCRFASPLAPDQTVLAGFDQRSGRFYDWLLSDTTKTQLAHALEAVDSDFELLSLLRGATTQLGVRAPVAKRLRLERFARSAPGHVHVTSEREPRDFSAVCQSVKLHTGWDLSSARVRAGIGRGHLIEVVVQLSDASGPLDVRAERAAELAVEGCLGERTVDDWVASIDTAPMPRGGPLKLIDAAANRDQTFPLHELRLTVERTVEGVRAGLPARPLCLEPSRADWLLLEAQPDQTSDVGQADLMVASTCAPEMLKCYLQAAPFSSLRFSRCGERFAYLKYRASGEFAARVEARQVLEDELDRELRARGLGCVVGNGVGSAHCYIDFALLDVDSAIALVCEGARAAELSERSWVLFCDTEWQLEWVSVWDGAQAPI